MRSSNSRGLLSRRDMLRLASAGVVSYSMSGWLGAMADEAAADPKRKKSCILLWMNGGPSTIDMWDLKPGHANGGPFKEIVTATPGIKISEHLPKIATFMDKMAIIRSMNTKEGDHGLGTYYLHTGYAARGPIQYPSIGSLIAKEIGTDEAALPNYVSIAPYRQFNAEAYGSGFLGPKQAPLIVGDIANPFGQVRNGGDPDYGEALKVKDLVPSSDLSKERFDARIGLLDDLQKDFISDRPDVGPRSHQTAYERAVKLMRTAASKAFNLEDEPAAVRDAYGRNLFGQGCLLARRLVEKGVPFVEVTLGQGPNNNFIAWDTHADNFNQVKALSGVLDNAWSTLMTELKDRGLLDSTLIVWMGEFGRTPQINQGQGRDHFANAWSTVLAGGGIKGGQVIGKTSADGTKVEEREVTAPDFLATVAKALGIDPLTQNMSNVGRPIRVADPGAKPITEIL